MEKLVSNWCKDQSLPESYIFPPETRPGKLSIPSADTIPVVDLGEASINRSNTILKVLKASQEFGFFQVVNHGVSENLLNDTMKVVKEFFDMTMEDKASLYSEDPNNVCRLYTSNINYGCEKVHFWRDVLKHPCHPLEECIKLWPEKPTRYREVIGTFSVEAKNLGLRILELLSEGLGLESGQFEDDLSEAQLLVANHYPPCPDPSLTLGLPKHCDPNLITILLQGDAYGLQVFKDGEWIGVEPLPNAFVFNIGHQLRVVNHGIPENLMNETMDVFKEFFKMPAEEKAMFYSEDPKKSCRLVTSCVNYDWEKTHLWRDNLRHPCHPLEEFIKLWPEKPTRYREVVATYSIEAKKLGLRILELVSEGLGLESGYFGDKLSEALLLSVNHYPPCPDPSLTLGLSKHCDPNLLTILHQGNVNGLQVFKDGEWIGVEPLHNAIVVNVGNQLQIISNNKLKSAEHRVVTNSIVARTTAAFFIAPSDDSIIEPAKPLIDHACNSPLYRAFEYKEFVLQFLSVMGNNELALEPFKLQA